MPDRDVQLDKTTQTDLLYGLAREQASDVAVLERAADATSSHVFDESDPIVQQAATREDLSLLFSDSGVSHPSGRPHLRWRYLEGAPPPERKLIGEAPLPVLVEPHVPWSLGRAAHQALRGAMSWLISFGLHLMLLPTLAVLGFPEEPVARPVVTYRGVIAKPPAHFDMAETMVDVKFATDFDLHTSRPIHAELAIPEPAIDRGAMPGGSTEIANVAMAWKSAGPVSDVLGLMATAGRGKGTSGEGQTGAEFFGSKAAGRRFVFVVDCSLSMLDDGRWPAAATELCAAIDRLTPEQLFYVILFDGGVHRMFNHDERQMALFPATVENKQRFKQWLATVRLGPDTFPFLAMRSALALQPDAIYFLSDGEFKDSTATFLRKYNRKFDHFGNPQHQVAVHTLAFHHYRGEAIMRRIAADNAGKYLFIPKR